MLDMLLVSLGTSYIYHNALVALGPFLWGEDHGMKFSHIYSSQSPIRCKWRHVTTLRSYPRLNLSTGTATDTPHWSIISLRRLPHALNLLQLLGEQNLHFLKIASCAVERDRISFSVTYR